MHVEKLWRLGLRIWAYIYPQTLPWEGGGGVWGHVLAKFLGYADIAFLILELYQLDDTDGPVTQFFFL
jgi:hypoxanthine phosphoribosyltransferase